MRAVQSALGVAGRANAAPGCAVSVLRRADRTDDPLPTVAAPARDAPADRRPAGVHPALLREEGLPPPDVDGRAARARTPGRRESDGRAGRVSGGVTPDVTRPCARG